MDGFLDVIVLHVRNNPYVAGILPKRIARVLSNLRSLEIFLSWIFLRYADSVEIEDVFVRLSEPQNRFIATGKAVLAVQSVLEAPNDPVAELQAELFANSIDIDIERKDLAVLRDMIPCLPAEASILSEYPSALTQGFLLLLEVVFKLKTFLVSLTDIVRRRSYDKPRARFWDRPKKP